MSVEKELELLVPLVLQAFNDQFSTNLKPDEVIAEIKRPQGQELFIILINTKNPLDETRFALAVTEFANLDSIGKFNLRLRHNGGSGNVKDEIFIAQTKLYWVKFKHIQSYIKSSAFEELKNRDVRLKTKAGGVVSTATGIPVKTLV